MSRDIKMVYIRGRTNPAFSTKTVVEEVDGKLIVTREAKSNQAQKHIGSLSDTYSTLSTSKLSKLIAIAQPIDGPRESFTTAYISGEGLEHKMQALLFSGDFKGFIFEAEKLKQLIDLLEVKQPNNMLPFADKKITSKFSKHIGPAVTDLNFDNFIVDAHGKWHLFDYEWCFEGTAPAVYVFTRSLYWFFQRLGKSINALGPKLIKISQNVYLPTDIYSHFADDFANLDDVLALEKSFQDYVIGGDSGFNDLAVKPRAAKAEIILSADVLKNHNQVLGELEQAHSEIDALRNHINSIEESRSYKLSRKIAKTYKKIKP